VRFLSVEPLLQKIDLSKLDCAEACPECTKPITASAFTASAHCDCCVEGDEPICWGGLHWVIVGGESGGGRRDCGVEAIEGVAEQCVNAGVPVFVKQDCSFRPGQQGRISEDVWKLKQYPIV
jgi:protein gp37